MKKAKNSRYSRIILARDGFPFLGGSATFLYFLFESLQGQIPKMEYWNVVTPRLLETGRRHYGSHWSNPRGLDRVRTFLVDGRRGLSAMRLALKRGGKTVVLSKSRKVTPLIRQLDPEAEVWHLTSTSSIVKNAVAAGQFPSMENVVQRIQSDRPPRLRSREEFQTVRAADRILCHTTGMRFWYHTFYPHHREKIQENIFWDYPLLKRQFKNSAPKTPWKKRPIDMLFVATRWDRGEKNFQLMRRLCSHFARRKKVMVVGFVPRPLPEQVIWFDTMTQWDVVRAMAESKAVVCPSRYDEAPNILFEAALMGSNIVCSKNCGNYRLTPQELVAQLNFADFVRKINSALKEHQPGETAFFSEHDLKQWLVKELSA